MDLCWWLCEHRAEGHLADCLHSHSWSRAKGNANNSAVCKPAQWVTDDTTERTSWWTALAEQYSVPPLLTGAHSSPAFLTLQLKNGSGSFYFNNWGIDLAPDSAVTTTEKRGCPTLYPVQVLVTTAPITSTSKGITASTPWGKMWQTSMIKTALAPKILDSCSLHRDTPIEK